MKIEKALVVDDSRVAHLNLRKLLTERNIEVDWVGSGEDCLVYLKRQKPDIVFMDVMMPGMDGFDTTGMINNDPSINAPPVVMCSANATDEDRQNAEKNGAVEFLSKPYTAEKLDQILAAVSALITTNTVEAVQPARAVAQQRAVPVDGPRNDRQSEVSSPPPEKPVAPVFDLPRITQAAERTARSTAEEVARKVAAELARVAAEKTVRLAIKESEGIARGVAKEVSNEIARTVAENVARQVSESMAGQMAAGGQSDNPAAPESIRESLQAQIVPQVQAVLRQSMKGEEFKQQLTQAVEKTARPLLELRVRDVAAQTAHQVAIQVLEEATRPAEEAGQKTALLRANLALTAAMIALIATVALKFFL